MIKRWFYESTSKAPYPKCNTVDKESLKTLIQIFKKRPTTESYPLSRFYLGFYVLHSYFYHYQNGKQSLNTPNVNLF